MKSILYAAIALVIGLIIGTACVANAGSKPCVASPTPTVKATATKPPTFTPTKLPSATPTQTPVKTFTPIPTPGCVVISVNPGPPESDVWRCTNSDGSTSTYVLLRNQTPTPR